MGRLRLPLMTTLGTLVLVAGCGVEDSGAGATTAVLPSTSVLPAQVGDTATWELLDLDLVSPATQWLPVGVTRLGCSDGKTGTVLEPQVSVEHARIVIRTDVEKIADGAHDCQGNDRVEAEVDLGQPIGGRDLVDAACLDSDAVDTAACAESVRWTSPARGASSQVPDWEAPADYSFTAQSSCGERGFIGRFAVTVEGGQVMHVEPLGDSWEGVTPDVAPTLSAMLDEARDAQSRGGVVEVAVDDAGVPSWIFHDPIPSAVDDEACYAISDYRSG